MESVACPPPPPTAGPPQPDPVQLDREGERIERLLEELRRTAGPSTWPRVEELVHRIVHLYGAGLERVLDHVAAAEGKRERLDALLCADGVVSGLLLIHGLHPRSVEERVHEALERVRPQLGLHAGGVELLALDPEQRSVRLRFVGSCHGCPSAAITAEHTLRRAIEEAAPEVQSIEVEAGEPPARVAEGRTE